MTAFTLPELCLVVLIGASGSGKSTFARKHFKATEVLSSDYCRGLVSNDENSQDATNDAFDVLRYIAAKRLERIFPGTVAIADPGAAARADANSELISKAVLVIVVLALAIGGIAVTNTMVMAVMERERD